MDAGEAEATRETAGSWVALAITVALSAAIVAGIDSWWRAALALAFCAWVPGSAIAAWMCELTPSERRGVSVTLSLTASIAVPTVGLWAHWWHPAALFALVAVPSVASHAVAATRPSIPLVRMPRLALGSTRTVAIAYVVATICAGAAIGQLSRNDHVPGQWGLVSDLPAMWFGAVLALGVGAGLAWRAGARWAGPATAVLLVGVLHATAAAAYALPRLPWAYKHVGVTDLILDRGSLSSSVDIYNNWPGFFAFTAHLIDLGGVADPLGLVRWWPVLAEVATVVVLRFFFGALTDDRRIQWGGVALLLVANWMAQDYFSPQSVSFVLAFGTFGLLLRTSAVPERLEFEVARKHRQIYSAFALVVFATITFTHQLTPYLMLPGIVIGCIIGGIRPRWIAGACVAIALAYLAPRYGWVRSHGGVGTTGLAENVKSPTAELAGAVASVDVSQWAGRALTGGLALASIPYLIRFWRDRWWLALLISNLVGPACVLFVSAYGNEGVLRTALFATPWMAFSAVAWLAERSARPRRSAGLGCATALSGGALLFTLAAWGLDTRYRVGPEELDVVRTYEATAPTGALLVQLGPGHLPVRLTSRYPELEYQSASLLARTDDVEAVLRRLEADAAPVARRRPVYVSSTTSAEELAEVFGYGSAERYAELRAAIERSPRWTLVIADEHALLARFKR